MKQTNKPLVGIMTALLFFAFQEQSIFACQQIIKKTFYVNDTVNTQLPINPGDKITFAATGQVRFGAIAGTGGPEGVIWCYDPETDEETGETFCSTNPYSPFPGSRHGALMGAIKKDPTVPGRDWFLIGAGGSISSSLAGILVLDVNDTDAGNNVGKFTVEVEVCKSPNVSLATNSNIRKPAPPVNNATAANNKKPVSEIANLAKLEQAEVELKAFLSIASTTTSWAPLKAFADKTRPPVDAAINTTTDEDLKNDLRLGYAAIYDYGFLRLYNEGKLNRQNPHTIKTRNDIVNFHKISALPISEQIAKTLKLAKGSLIGISATIEMIYEEEDEEFSNKDGAGNQPLRNNKTESTNKAIQPPSANNQTNPVQPPPVTTQTPPVEQPKKKESKTKKALKGIFDRVIKTN